MLSLVFAAFSCYLGIPLVFSEGEKGHSWRNVDGPQGAREREPDCVEEEGIIVTLVELGRITSVEMVMGVVVLVVVVAAVVTVVAVVMTTPPPFPLPTSQWLPQPCFLVVLGYWLCFVPVVA